MKEKFLGSLFFFYSAICFSQTDTAAPYWKHKNIPAFVLLNADSSRYSNSNLQKDKYTIIMLFNPECEHCQDQFKLLVSIPEVAASAQVLMSSTETMDKIKTFSSNFKVDQYPFVHLAKDDQYVFGKCFQPKTIPVLAFYDQDGHFKAIKQGSATRKEIIAWLK